jgi:cholesterol oxidase
VANEFDAIVVGSGFGGAVSACRLAAAGVKVMVLERGRRWSPATFPRAPHDPWLWDDRDPLARHGWFDFRVFPNMSVVQGAGVGGGSLVYANISVDAKPDTFEHGFPPEIRFGTLAPHYAEVGRMLGVRPVPLHQIPARTKLLKEAATNAGYEHRFRQLDLAVTFDDTWSDQLPDPYSAAHSRSHVNQFGIEQGTCVHLGNCDIGCDVNARNTLDLNYLAAAQRDGAEVRPLHIVRRIHPVPGGFEVHVEEIGATALRPDVLTASVVILSAGSLGSTEILLRSRAAGSLPDLSDQVGRGWSSNGDFLTPAFHFLREVNPTRGPTITAAIDLLDGEFQGKGIFIEDGGIPDVGRAFLERFVNEPHADPRAHTLIASILPLLGRADIFRHVMPWFAQARDAADGRLHLEGRPGATHLALDWDVTASQPTIEAVAALHRKLAFLTAGVPLTPVTWTSGHDLVTPHPLGGCNMGTDPQNGVVNHRGAVFNYPGLYVADGSIVPKALGLNPSKTIAALAERIAMELVMELGGSRPVDG